MPRIYKCLDVAERLNSNSIPVTECGCLIWLSHLNNMGYGRLHVDGKGMRYAHRMAWEQKHGKIPAGLNVLHKCDIPMCINPEHLFLGTHADNVADKVRKNRQLRGEDIGNSKLTEKEVIAIRSSTIGVNETARRTGFSPMTVSLLRNRKTWKHI